MSRKPKDDGRQQALDFDPAESGPPLETYDFSLYSPEDDFAEEPEEYGEEPLPILDERMRSSGIGATALVRFIDYTVPNVLPLVAIGTALSLVEGGVGAMLQLFGYPAFVVTLYVFLAVMTYAYHTYFISATNRSLGQLLSEGPDWEVPPSPLAQLFWPMMINLFVFLIAFWLGRFVL